MRPSFVRGSAILTTLVSLAVGAHCAGAGIWTTPVASLAMLAGAAGVLRGRTWGALLMLAVGASFAAAAALGMTNAPELFLAIAIVASVPAIGAARGMERLDRGAAIAAVLAAIAWGSIGAATIRSGGELIAALGRAHASIALSRGEATVRYCGPRLARYAAHESALRAAFGLEAEYADCGTDALRDSWNAGYYAQVRDDVEARCGEGALESLTCAPDGMAWVGCIDP